MQTAEKVLNTSKNSQAYNPELTNIYDWHKMYSDELNMLVLRTEGYSSLHGVH